MTECKHTVMDRVDETTWECPKCGVTATSLRDASRVQNFVISGIEIKPGLEVKPLGSSAYVGIPKKWIGGEVVAILVDGPPEIEISPRRRSDLISGINKSMKASSPQSVKELSRELKLAQRETRKLCTTLIGLGKLRREGKNYFYMDKISKE